MQLHDWVRSPRTVYWHVAMALAQLVIAGCSGGGPPATGVGQPPAATPTASSAGTDERTSSDLSGCEPLTQEEVAKATGEPVTGQDDSGLRGCEWKVGDRTQVLLQVFSGSTNTCAAQRSLGSGREENVPGLGDSATWQSGGRLVVCTSRAVVVLDIENTPNRPDEDKEAAVTMARSILKRL